MVQYQRYLYSVLEQTEDYKEIRALIERWNTLQATAMQLRETIAQNLKESETIRVALQKYSQVIPSPPLKREEKNRKK